MKKLLVILAIIILGFLGYWAFHLGWILVKVFIGLMFIAVFAFGVVIGRISK